MKRQKRKGFRRKGIHWDYNFDGIYPKERLSKFWKRYWNKWKKRLDSFYNKKALDT